MGRNRYDAIRIAKELGYSAETIRKLSEATTETEILNILVDAWTMRIQRKSNVNARLWYSLRIAE